MSRRTAFALGVQAAELVPQGPGRDRSLTEDFGGNATGGSGDPLSPAAPVFVEEGETSVVFAADWVF